MANFTHVYVTMSICNRDINTVKNVSLLLNLELVSEVEPLKSEGHLLNKDRVDKEWKEAAMVWVRTTPIGSYI